MTKRPTWMDRLRIERAVWTLDALVQDLPGQSRKAIRREMRANLRAAAVDVGAAQAVRSLGNLRRLAVGYLDAEYGEDRPRPHWRKATFWVLAVEITLLLLAFAGHSSFVAGVEAADPRPDGTYTWDGLTFLGVEGDVTYEAGTVSSFSITLSLVMLLYLLAALVLGGRLWRLPGAWWRRRQRDRSAADLRAGPGTTCDAA
jgi:hypothetical protein